MSQTFKLKALAVAVGLAFTPTAIFAAEDDAANDEKVVVLGSRSAPRSVSDSPVPIDLISGDDFVNHAGSNLLDTMSTLVPSFNVNTQPISDAATMVRPANMRGLPPDSTLILVNGKRRHRSAVISFLGAGLADGSQGPDISVIPAMALSQVEVLRDGAAAQYGSDAIAGVMNFVLKDDNDGGTVSARFGGYSEGDGDTLRVAGNFGVPLTENGFVNVTWQFKESDATSRSVQRDDAAGLIAAGNIDVADPAQVWGSPEISEDVALFVNMGIDLDSDSQAYLHANYAERHVEGGFFFRNPTNRGGVYDGPIDPETGLDTILVGDETPGATDNSNCPVVTLSPDGIPDPTALGQLAAANCFAFNLLFPGGFTPRFGGDVLDMAVTAGVKGYYTSGIGYDFSGTVGRSDVTYQIFNTINPSLGSATPTEFSPGTYIETDKSLNADFTKEISVAGWDYPVNVAWGYEYKHDTFEIIAGDPGSFAIGPLAVQGFGSGSNGFPGFQPEAAGDNSRSNHAFYLDAELQVTDDVLIGGAVRAEDYSDFGSTLDGKLTTQISVTDEISFRGSISTGFRAPTVGQSNVRNVTTAFDENLRLADEATLPPTDPIAQQKGAIPLTPEEAESLSFGFVAEFDELFMTVDFYRIDVSDRIGVTGNFVLTPDDISDLLDAGHSDAASFTSVKYFTNAFDTRTEGVDFVANYSLEQAGGTTTLALVSSYVKTDVTKRDESVISDTKKFQLESTLPKYRTSFTVNHAQNDWSVMGRLNYYGSFTETHLDSGDLLIDNDALFTVDAAVNYTITDDWSVSVGAQNILDEYPQKNTDFDFIVGAQYTLTHPIGFNGAYYYAEVTYNY